MPKLKLTPIINPIYTTSLTIRINDINYGNHLGNDAVVSLMHEARMRFLSSMGFSELNIDGIGILITTLVVNYKSQAFYGDKIKVDIGVNEITKTGLDIQYQFKNKKTEKEISRSVTTITFYDYKKSKVTHIPNVFLDAISGLNRR